MDRTLERLVDFALGAELGTLPPRVVRAATCRYLDSVGCAAGAFAAAPARIARQVAATAHCLDGASAFGLAHRTTPEYATFANSVATRRSQANAIAMSITPKMPLHVARTGELSHWKGCAGPQAAMNAMWAVRLAKAGMTGPARPFDGVRGFFDAVAPATLERLGQPIEGRLGLERVFTKALPACGHALAPVEGVMRLRGRVSLDDIAAIDILTYEVAWKAIGGGAGDAHEKWAPKTRETADHSLPYLVAIALLDGDVGLDSFEPERIADPRLPALMDRIAVRIDDDMERRFRQDRQMASRIVIRLHDGAVLEEGAYTSRGKPDRPMTEDDFSAKFLTMAPKILPQAEVGRLLDMLWNVGELPDLDELTALFRKWGTVR